MKKLTVLAGTAAVLVVLAACGGGFPETSEPRDEPVPAPMALSLSSAAETYRDGSTAIFTAGGIEIPVPAEYLDLLVTEIPAPETGGGHVRTLFTCREKASMEAGQLDHPGEDWGEGWLFSIRRTDQVGYEAWLTTEGSGTNLFAADAAGNYYLTVYPTDVRFHRAEANSGEGADAGQWNILNEWGASLPDAIVARNAFLEDCDPFALYRQEYTYDGAHALVAYDPGGARHETATLVLSQPVRQGEGGVWCVERVKYEYGDDGWTDTQLQFPAGNGADMTADAYYARLQAECDAGEHSELLTPMGAALAFARASTWTYTGAEGQNFTLLP